jgi:hypothetical protein
MNKKNGQLNSPFLLRRGVVGYSFKILLHLWWYDMAEFHSRLLIFDMIYYNSLFSDRLVREMSVPALSRGIKRSNH